MSRAQPQPVATHRITGLEAFRLRLPLTRRAEREGRSRPFLEHILVRVEDALGSVGWGEITPVTDISQGADTLDTCWRQLREVLAPALLDHDWTRPEEAGAAWARVKGGQVARAGLDMACWDLWSRARGRPLSHALGGTRTAVATGVTLAAQSSVEQLVELVNRQVSRGYRSVTLTIGPGRDIEPVRAVRSTYPHLAVQADARGGYPETPESLAALRALDDYGLEQLRQPFAPGALVAHARLQRRLRTPVGLDLSVTGTDQLDTAIELEAARAVTLRVPLLGGLTAARRAHDRAVDAGWLVWCGGGREFGVGRAANVALAGLPGVSLLNEPAGADRNGTGEHGDIVEPPVRADDGVVAVPLAQPGLGHEVDEARVRALAGAVWRA
ncbi:enolase C-terminal domain-like protein [Allonocardiopsis opalescens]|uniref:O-succinylbenzoate synthase n=1 Tax=Allonocardiopsis opalescens TaxID=1144618 RepID=A0A2T0Q037_9ACTN|nr:enolase C-terminal domain-like protein [Allonocardiopsis opalescens]PRX97162.1 O-succinylbenzoate synthase [Allonocardiopsis opalescens]